MPYMQGLTRAQGDPGFFSFLGKGLSAVGGLLPGPLGAGARAIGGLLAPQRGRQLQEVPMPPPLRVPVPGVTGAVQRFLPGGATGFVECPGEMQCPKGMRPNKSAYFLKDGTFVAPGTRCVPIRRTNPTNVRALRRAIRREEQFIRLARKTGLVTVPKAKRVRSAARKRSS